MINARWRTVREDRRRSPHRRAAAVPAGAILATSTVALPTHPAARADVPEAGPTGTPSPTSPASPAARRSTRPTSRHCPARPSTARPPTPTARGPPASPVSHPPAARCDPATSSPTTAQRTGGQLSWTIPSLTDTLGLTYRVRVDAGAWHVTLDNVLSEVDGGRPCDTVDEFPKPCDRTSHHTPGEPTPPGAPRHPDSPGRRRPPRCPAPVRRSRPRCWPSPSSCSPPA